MRNKTSTWIFFFLFLLTASGVFAAFSENSRQGLPAISVTSQPAFSLENPEQRQGLSRVLLELMSGGAFISKDPIGFNGGFNLYRYADNNPIRYTDPTGLFVVETLAVLTVKEILIGTGLFGGAVYFNTPEGKKTLADFVQKLQSGATWTKEKIQDAFHSVTCELLPDTAAEQIYLASANDSGSGSSSDDSGSNNISDPNDPKDPRQKVIEALDQIFKNHRFTREEISTAVDRITRFIQQYEMRDPRVAAIIRQVIEEILGRRN